MTNKHIPWNVHKNQKLWEWVCVCVWAVSETLCHFIDYYFIVYTKRSVKRIEMIFVVARLSLLASTRRWQRTKLRVFCEWKKNQFPLHTRTTAPNVSIRVCSLFHIQVSAVTFYICNDCLDVCGCYIFVMIFDSGSFCARRLSLSLSRHENRKKKSESKRCEIIRRFTDDIYLHGTNYQCQTKTYRFTETHSLRHNKPSSSSKSDRDGKNRSKSQHAFHFINFFFARCWNWCIYFTQFVRWQLAVTIKQIKHFADAKQPNTGERERESEPNVSCVIVYWLLVRWWAVVVVAVVHDACQVLCGRSHVIDAEQSECWQ